MELWHTVTENNEALLSPLQCEEEHLSAEESNAAVSEKRKEFTEAPLHHQTVRMGDLRHLDAENTVASVHSLPKIHEELEESHQGFQATSEDPSVFSPETLHVHNMSWHPPNHLHFPTSVHQDKQNPPLNPQPVTLFADISPSFHVHPRVMPHFNPVFLPHLSSNVVSNASVPHHNPFCPISTPQINFNLPFKPNFTALVACEDPIRSSLVLGPHLKVYPAHLRPSIYQTIRTDGDGSGRAPPDLQDSFRLWQRLCETARLFCSSTSDAEALACYFISVVPSLVVQRPDLPFSAAVNAAVQDWRKTSTFERQQYYNTAKIFVEMEEQDKSANREKEDPMIPQRDKRQGRCPQHTSGKVKKTSKRCKKEPPVQDLAESALNEYSQVMDALGSKVTKGSEVTAANEEDVCALFFNQLLNDSECTTEAGFDMDYINSLLSTDPNISDVLKDIPEPVAGCSAWTQIQPSSDDFSTNLLLSEDHMTENIYTFQENVKDLNEFQMFAEPLLANPELQCSQTDLNASVQETLHSLHQDFGPEADGNHEDETEIDSATQSNCFHLQNYKSHNATFPHTDPEILVDGELEHNEEKNTVVRQKTEKYMKEGIPNDSQKTRSVRNKQTNLKESPKMDQNEEINVNKNKKHQRRHRRRKHVVRTLRKSDDKDEKVKTQRKSAKHDARERETDFIKMNTKRVELQNITEATSLGKCVNLRKIDDEFERRQRWLKSVGRVGKQQMTKAETYRRVEGQRPKKQGNLSVEEDCGDFHRKTEVCQRLRRETRPKLNVQTINVLEKVDEMTI